MPVKLVFTLFHKFPEQLMREVYFYILNLYQSSKVVNNGGWKGLIESVYLTEFYWNGY